jgi:hypothetical protein
MKNPKTSRAGARSLLSCLLFVAIVLSAACSSDKRIVPSNFQLTSPQETQVLAEGNAAGLSIPLALSRQNEHITPVQLGIEGVTSADEAFLTSSFTQLTLNPGNDNSQLILSLAIADLPILAQRRQFRLFASDGTDTHEIILSVDIVPVDAPDVYLLIGQSNMVGFSGDDTRQAFAGGLDETNPRIRQLNVSPNDQNGIFLERANFTSIDDNVNTPRITTAEDPLHVSLDLDNINGKTLDYIGLGLSFAKAALPNTTRDIVLVPAAWSGSAFCAIDPGGPPGQWNAQATTDAALGNTWLFDRAVTRANLALQETGGILRGILWHQGESDSNDACAQSYAANLERLAQQLRMRISADARGEALRQNDSNIPFVVGTMSLGIDSRDDLSKFSTAKQLVDNAHRNLPNVIAFSSFSNHDDLVPANGYPCGNTTCVHFGATALREMGRRYYQELERAALQRPTAQ